MSAPSPHLFNELHWSYWRTKAFVSALQLDVFTELAKGPADATELTARLGLRAAQARDLLDALVAMGLLERGSSHYGNTAESDHYLDRNKPHTYLGDVMLNEAATLGADITAAVRDGRSREDASTAQEFYANTYADAERARSFQRAMTALSFTSGAALAKRLPWERYRTFVDVGCAEGAVGVHVLRRHPHLTGIGFDLPEARGGFESYAAEHEVAGRAEFRGGNFLAEPLPAADVVILGHVLHNWDLDVKRELLRKAHQALHPDGMVVVYEALIDDDRKRNTVGLLMSLMMHLSLPGGFDFTASDCVGWLRDAGFRSVRAEHLAGPESMMVGIR
ncbi:methyltransferase [Streptomyces scopuliridis]|uniref:methyltransferase n=1 Tax=Streptomyces scopuliridis TaxID=452529 RepID=UPI0035DF21A1